MQLQLEEKQALLQEFQSLSTIKDKIAFWQDKLGSHYYSYVISLSNYAPSNASEPYRDLHDFRINTTDKQEIKVINQYLLDFPLFSKRGDFRSGSRFDLSTMITELDARLEDVKNKTALLELELKKMDDYILQKNKPSADQFSALNEWFTYGYQNYLLDQKEADISRSIFYDFQHLIAELDGIVIAKYQHYLKTRLEEAKNDKPRKIEPLSLEQQYLALDYLGVLDKLQKVKDDSNTLKGQFISLLIGKDSSNCRQLFSYLPQLKNGKTTQEKRKIKKNLTRVRDLFEEMGLKSLSKKVQDDLNDLGQ